MRPPRRGLSASPGGRGAARGQEEARRAQDAHFWELQAELEQQGAARGGPPRVGRARLQAEEQELFGGAVNAGIDFLKYEGVDVERSGKAASRLPVGQSYSDVFAMFEVPQWLRENMSRCGYCTPTPVQKSAVPAALVGRDIMVCAQTGSGKTCAFLLPMMASCAAEPNRGCQAGNQTFKGPASPRGLILSPTRELCLQIHLEARKLAFQSHIRALVIYGGVTAWHQIKDLARGVDILTATPGRLQDFHSRGLISLQQCEFCVLDEADRMLDMGFEPAVRKTILHSDMPSSEVRQTMMFSATFAQEVQVMAQDFLYEYVWIGVGRVGGASESITQKVFWTLNSKKPEMLLDHLSRDVDTGEKLEAGSQAAPTMVFCGMKRTCTWLAEYLRTNGHSADDIHGEREQWEREKTLRDFRSGKIRCLVASDVAARGLDIPGVARVVNYDLPGSADDYVHRIGRTGRAGRRGLAVAFFVLEPEPGLDAAGRPQCLHDLGLAPELLALLRASGQEAPGWLEAAAAREGGEPGRCRGGRGRDARSRRRARGGAPER